MRLLNIGDAMELPIDLERLLAEQEPLGAVFEKILHDNLWDLYEGDEPGGHFQNNES